MSCFVLCPWPRPALQDYYADPSLKISTYSAGLCHPIAPPDPVPVSGRGGRALKQSPVLGPDNRDLLPLGPELEAEGQRDNTIVQMKANSFTPSARP